MGRALAIPFALPLLLSLLSGFALLRPAQAFADIAQLRAERPFQIKGLGFFTATVPVEIRERGSPDQQMTATVRGQYARKDWTLLGPNGKKLPPRFEVKVHITAQRTPVRFTAVGPYGNTQSANLVVIDPSYVPASEGANEVPSLGKNTWNFGLGATSISYSQTGLASFSELALTPKISFQHAIDSSWDLGASAFGTALPITSNPSGLSAYFMGVNARAGYVLPVFSKPWTLSVALGLYYATMTTSGENFGYRNLAGPQFFPTLRRSLNSRNMIGTYLKYSPVTEVGQVGFESHELAAGLSFTHILPRRRSLSLTLDYSSISVQLGSETASASTLTGGVGYGF